MLWFIKILFGVEIKPPRPEKTGRKIRSEIKKSFEDEEDNSALPVIKE